MENKDKIQNKKRNKSQQNKKRKKSQQNNHLDR
jgi:hypothetical protein